MRLALVYPFWKLETDSAPTQAMDVVAGGHATEMSRLAAVDVYLRGEGGRSQRVDESGVTFHRLSGRPEQLMRPLQRMRYKVLGVEEGEERQVGHMAYAWQAALAMRRTGADAAQVYIFDSYLPVLRRMNPRAHIVVSIHDHRQVTRNPDVVASNLRQADRIVACSRFMAEELVDRLPEFEGRCTWVHNAVDTARFRPMPSAGSGTGEARVLFVGRISPEKGVHDLIDAFCRVALRHPMATLHLLGPPSVPVREITIPTGGNPLLDPFEEFWGKGDAYLAHVQSMVPAEIRDRVRFLTAQGHDAVADHLAGADILVFPSVWEEPFGLPVIEAMASGVPVVATRSGALPELVSDGETGVLVDRGDPDALAGTLDRLLADPTLRSDMGASGRRRAVDAFSWEANTRAWTRLYEPL